MDTVSFPRLVDVAPVPAPQVEEVPPIARAYAKVRDELGAVPEEQLAPANVDVGEAIDIVKNALGRMAPLRERMARELPSLDLASIDKLADYAGALAYTHARLTRPETVSSQVPAMYEEALSFRETVLAVGKVLAKLQLLDASLVDKAGANVGYRNVGYELFALCDNMLARYDSLAGRCALTREQLVRGRSLANQLLDAAAVRERSSAAKLAGTLERQRAYYLFARAYGEARRAITFLRWNEGDADEIAPSLYVNRNRGRKADDTADASVPSVGTAPSTAPLSDASLDATAPSIAAAAAKPEARDTIFFPVSHDSAGPT